ncbi:hypothetical protein [Alkalihalobacillus trypoxylicola]|uniref:Uncharacterized protein n=1 Tax=Alkalihalobacillus trypoxylicola TaxID=519424 RepID=A0A162EKV3_9BACI|nr:hypothetical protein [Alkalihalobacillus trypoxylicola]KYG33147.1 hypothetical protein AZF04_17530 [Alkalihalobacillus trypoxylicola]
MKIDQHSVSTSLLKLLNKQTDLNGHQIDLVDGFVFMLKKIKNHQKIRLKTKGQIHPRFWKSHNRAFGYLIKESEQEKEFQQLYQFYFQVALLEEFLNIEDFFVKITEKGLHYLQLTKEEQLELLFQKIWGPLSAEKI